MSNNAFDKDVGFYLKAISKKPLLTREQEHALADARDQGDRSAVDRLVEHNLRLVVNIAKRYVQRTDALTLLDLVQEGNMGLMRAAQDFDSARGLRFSTYASTWIKQRILYAVAMARLIRLPKNVVDQIAEAYQAQEKLAKELNRPLTPQESQKCFEDRNLLNVWQMLRSGLVDSFDFKHAVGETSLASRLRDKKVVIPGMDLEIREQIALFVQQVTDMMKVLEGNSRFPPRDIEIFLRRNGMRGFPKDTLKNIGIDFGLTRERVRQLEERCWTTLEYSDSPIKSKEELERVLDSIRDLNEIVNTGMIIV